MPNEDESAERWEEKKAATRFMVGGSSGKYLHGRSTKPILSLDLKGAQDAVKYLSGLDYGKFGIFELVPVAVDEDGIVTRQA